MERPDSFVRVPEHEVIFGAVAFDLGFVEYDEIGVHEVKTSGFGSVSPGVAICGVGEFSSMIVEDLSGVRRPIGSWLRLHKGHGHLVIDDIRLP